MTLDSLGLKLKRKILYLFDYGDGHEFDVEVLAINERAQGNVSQLLLLTRRHKV